MKIASSLAVFVLGFTSLGVTSASTLYIGSYGAVASVTNPGYSNPGFSNTTLAFSGGTTFDIGTGGGYWAGPVSVNGLTSSWVAQDAGDCPSCGNTVPTGTYTYTTTFLGLSSYTGTITLLADDTSSIFLNGTLITAAAAQNFGGKCTTGTPNCTTPTTYTLSGFVNGTNTLTFGVEQLYGASEGLDFAGTLNTPDIATTPEPTSLALLGTGVLSMVGFVRRRLKS